MLMPGMLTDAQMKQLDARAGPGVRPALSHLHDPAPSRAPSSMVKDLFGSYGAAQDETVFKFASDVNVDQTTEIARMEKMLASMRSASRAVAPRTTSPFQPTRLPQRNRTWHPCFEFVPARRSALVR